MPAATKTAETPVETIEVQPDPQAVAAALAEVADLGKEKRAELREATAAAMERHAARTREKQSAARKPAAKPKAVKPKPAPRAKASKAERKIVPFAEVIAFLAKVGLNRSQAALATGKSASLWSEFTGHGRKTGLRVERWPAVQKQLKDYAAKSLK